MRRHGTSSERLRAVYRHRSRESLPGRSLACATYSGTHQQEIGCAGAGKSSPCGVLSSAGQPPKPSLTNGVRSNCSTTGSRACAHSQIWLSCSYGWRSGRCGTSIERDPPHSASRDVTDNALIELMHCASTGVIASGFERWRSSATRGVRSMRRTFWWTHTQIGNRRARFGQLDRCGASPGDALRIARRSRAARVHVPIERIKSGLRGSCQSPNEGPQRREARDPE